MNKSALFLHEALEGVEGVLEGGPLKTASESLLDYIGVTFAGARKNADRIEKMRPLFDEPPEGIRPIGLNAPYSLKDAVFLNGINAHAFDMDDGTNAGIIHLGSPIFSLLLPLAKQNDVGGERLLKAAILGYEVAFSLAVSVQPSHKLRGFHATGTCGCVGAAVAAAWMLGLSDKQLWDTFGAACVSASGMLAALDGASELKPYNVGKASLLALTSLQMGMAGFNGPDDPLFGERGFIPTLCGDKIRELSTPGSDGIFAIQRAYTKPYAACRYCHPAIEAAIVLAKECAADPEEIAKVVVEAYSLAVRGHDHTEIAGSASANMSIPYGVAVGFVYGKAGLREYAYPVLSDDGVLGLARKVTVKPNEQYSNRFPAEQPSKVTLTLRSGDMFSREVIYPKGEPQNPMSAGEKIEKFREMLNYAAVDAQDTELWSAAVMNVRENARPLYELMG